MRNCPAVFAIGCGNMVTMLCIPSTWSWATKHPILILCLIADKDGRIVVTKDDDFVQSFLLRNTPQRLMLVASGNIGNAELERLIIAALPTITEAFATAHYIEIGRNSVIVHE